MKNLLFALILISQAGLALAFESEHIITELRAYFPEIEVGSTNKLVGIANFLVKTPTAGGFSNVQIPVNHTKNTNIEDGPSSILFLPPQQYRDPLIDLLTRALSTRLKISLPAPQVCFGDPVTVTDCCTKSPTITCLENKSMLSPETTIFGLGELLYNTMAMDLLALELVDNVKSLSLDEIKGKSIQPDTLYLMLGDHFGQAGRYLMISLNEKILEKMAFLVQRLEVQIMERKGKQSRLGNSISCNDRTWKAGNNNEEAMWLTGDVAVEFRGYSSPLYKWLGLGQNQNTNDLVVITRESIVPTVQTSLYTYLEENEDAIAICFGPEFKTLLDQSANKRNFLKNKSVSAFFVAWLYLAGTMDVLSK